MITLAAINFIIGFLCGALIVILTSIWFGRSVLKKQLNKLVSSAKNASKSPVHADGDAMMDKVRELTLEQLDLRGQLDQPQKNALHGKHKNSISARIKELEEEKLSLLRQVLASGYDPLIGTIDENGDIKKMKLSEYMAEYDLLDKEVDDKKIVEKSVKKENPFKVIEGGKSSEETADGDDSNR